MDGYFSSNEFKKGRLIDSLGNQISGAFINQKLSGQGELKSSSLTYQGDFKDGEICDKGTFNWIKDEFKLKFAGTSQDRTFVQGKFEVKKDSTVVSSFEGIFNVPFSTANTQPPSQLPEESKENVEPASTVQVKV